MSGGRLEVSDSVIDLHSSSNIYWQGLHSPPRRELDHRFPRSGLLRAGPVPFRSSKEHLRSSGLRKASRT
jgi:hypothetical protein